MVQPSAANSRPAWVVANSKVTDDGFSFAEDAWQRYGGSSAWLDNLRSIWKSLVLERISGHLQATVVVAALISGVFWAERHGFLAEDLSWLGAAVEACALPGLPHEAVGSFIGLLLAFRTSQAYERFWEARKLWDDVYSSTRSIVRLATAAGREASEEEPGKARRLGQLIVGLTAAWPYSLKQHLRGERNVDELIDAATAAANCPRRSPLALQIKAAGEQPNVPLAVIECLTHALLRTRAIHGDLLWWQLDAKAEELIGILSKAERIKGTPVPLSYSRHTSRFFSVYAFTLPLALVGEHVDLFLIPPIVAIIAWVIFATEEIGHIIEGPFERGMTDDPDNPTAGVSVGNLQLEVLPLGRYCADIASDAATIFSASPTSLDEMPGGDEDIDLFDDPGNS